MPPGAGRRGRAARHRSRRKGNPMSHHHDHEQWHRYAHLKKRAAAGQINRRAFLELASAIGIGSISAASADRAMSAAESRGQGRCALEKSYDYIVVGAGSAGCAIAASLSENAACRVLLIEAGETISTGPLCKALCFGRPPSERTSIGPITPPRRPGRRGESSTGREGR